MAVNLFKAYLKELKEKEQGTQEVDEVKEVKEAKVEQVEDKEIVNVNEEQPEVNEQPIVVDEPAEDKKVKTGKNKK